MCKPFTHADTDATAFAFAFTNTIAIAVANANADPADCHKRATSRRRLLHRAGAAGFLVIAAIGLTVRRTVAPVDVGAAA